MPTVYANGRSIVHKGDGFVNVAAAPDVCKTPTPGGPVPVPYPNIANDSDLAQGSTQVTIEGNAVALEGSSLTMSTGDEAGSVGGIISSKIKGKMTWLSSSADVKIEGKGVVRFLDTCMHNGNASNTGGQPQLGVCAPPAPEEEVCEDKVEPHLKSITILEEDKTLAKGAVRQWVNLSHDKKWVDKSVKSIERTTQKLRFKVMFNKPGASAFRVVFDAEAENAAYTGAEKGRNADFEATPGQKSYQTDGDGTKIVEGDFKVSPAGRDRFKLVAEDDFGNTANTARITTCRRVYYVELKMKKLKSIAKNLTALRSEMQKHGVFFVRVPQATMDHMHNISDTDSATFQTKARAAYVGSKAVDKEPYALAIAFTDHLAVKDAGQQLTTPSVNVGPGKGPVVLDVEDIGGETHSLWNNLVPGEGWFVSASFLKDGGVAGVDDVAIPQANCTGVASNPACADDLTKIKVKVDTLPAGRGAITLLVDWVNRMRGGLSFPGGNLLCICTRAWWQDISTAEQNQVAIHEAGHSLGMVPDGSGKLPDKTTTHYTGKGHRGDHCHAGLAVLASYGNVSGDCVMFGATNGKTKFCDNCKVALQKMDLQSGWPRF